MGEPLYKVAGVSKTENDGLDLLLINVEYRWDQLFPDPNLGLLGLATLVRDRGYRVAFYDTQLDSFTVQTFEHDLLELGPRVVGLSCNSDNIFQVNRLLPIVRRALPHACVVLGGPHVTARPREVLVETAADAVVRGEGEETLLELMDLWVGGQGELAAIKGVVHWQDGRIVENSPRDFIADLNTLPIPDRELLPDYRRYSGNLISGRGCPYGCAFCFEGVSGNTYRSVSPEHTVEEISLLVDKYRYPYFSFADDTFIANPRRARQVCQMIIDRYGEHPPFGWYCEGRVDILSRHPELLPLMVRAGLVRLQLGVESGNQDILDIYEKKITLEQIEQVVRASVEADVLSIFANFIIGGPFETEARVQKSLDFALKLCDIAPGRMECYSTYLSPFAGTKIYQDPRKYGLRLLDRDLETGESMTYPFFESDEVDKWRLMNLKSRFDAQISKKMESRVASIPKSLIDRHIQAYERGMKSLWLPFFTNRRGINRYYRTLGLDAFRGYHDIPREEIMDWCPTRVVAPLMSENKRTVLVTGKRGIRLNEEGSLIYELSAGRKTTREVIDEVYTRGRKSLPPYEVFAEQVLEFYAQMDEEYAVIFKQV